MSHETPVEVGAPGSFGQGVGWGVRSSTGAAVARGLLGVQAPQNSPSLSYCTSTEQSNTPNRTPTFTKNEGACPSAGVTCWSEESTCKLSRAVDAVNGSLTATISKSRLLQHAKDSVFRWCKSAQLHRAGVIYTSWGMDQRHLLRLQCI